MKRTISFDTTETQEQALQARLAQIKPTITPEEWGTMIVTRRLVELSQPILNQQRQEVLKRFDAAPQALKDQLLAVSVEAVPAPSPAILVDK